MDPLERNRELLNELIRRGLEDDGWEVDLDLIRRVLETNGCNYGPNTDPDQYVAEGDRLVRVHLRRKAQEQPPSCFTSDGKEKDILTIASQFLQARGYNSSHAIDSIFFFYFDPKWRQRKRAIRRRFAGRDQPFLTEDEFMAWQDRWWRIPWGTSERYGPVFNGCADRFPQGFVHPWPPVEWAPEERDCWHEARDREKRDYEKCLEGVTADYGVDESDVMRHIWRGKPLYFPYVRISPIRDERGLPCIQLLIYSQHALEKLPANWLGRSWGDTLIFPELPYIGDRLPAAGHFKQTRKPSVKWEHRVRTWCIYHLSKAGGGYVKAEEAIKTWNSQFPEYQVESSNYHRDKKKVLQTVTWWLTRVREARQLYGRQEGAP